MKHQCTGCGHKVMRKPKACPQCGGSIWSSIKSGLSKAGNWVKGAANTVYNKAIVPAARGIKKGHDWVKDNKVISRVAAHLPGVGPTVGKIAGAVGYGKKRRATKGKMIGMGKRTSVGTMISM